MARLFYTHHPIVISLMRQFKRHLLTAALPYANGPVHIGHLAGVYVPADIYARYLRLKGKDVAFICGSDEHGVAITLRAKKEGKTPKEVVEMYHQQIKRSFEEFGISFDVYSRTSSSVHHQTAAGFFTQLHTKGVLTEDTSGQFYDEQENQFLADRYIKGTCPNCAYDEAYGDQCEKCGTSLTPKELINPRSTISGNAPVMRPTQHWYLPLDRYENWLGKWILKEHKEWKPNVYGQCKSWLDNGLNPRPITRDLEWGVKVPLPEASGKVLYVWFDAPIGYISATKEWASAQGKNWEDYWKSEDTRLIHFIGKDNIVFHCIIFPTILHAAGDYILPDNVPANEFLNLEGQKISTSRNWAVWLHEYLEDFPGKQDVLRYVLTANAPETKDNDFTWHDFQTRNNSELVGILGNFVHRALVLTQKYFHGKVPEPGAWQAIDEEVMAAARLIPGKIEQALEQFKFREALSSLMELARLGNKYLAETEPWQLIKTNEERVATILHVALQIVAGLGCFCAPFLPDTAKKLAHLMNETAPNWETAKAFNLLTAGEALQPPGLLFEKIEDQTIEQQMDRLKKGDQPEDAAGEVITAFKKEIKFEDFANIDLRVGTITRAESVPKSNKLLRFEVDLGLEKRTILSGVAKFFSPEEMLGKQVVVMANLAPRKIMGVESQGMLLFAENEKGQLFKVSPEPEAPNGSTIA